MRRHKTDSNDTLTGRQRLELLAQYGLLGRKP